MLRANHRVLRPGGRTAFHTITVPTGLSDRDRRRGELAGPAAVASTVTYPDLLRSAGFVGVEEADLTAAYLDTARAWLWHGQHHAAEFAALDPPGVSADKLARRQRAVTAIEDGLLRRSLFTARRQAHQR